jgi:hypothetical protein
MVNDIKNIIDEYSKKFAEIVNDYNRDSAVKTMRDTVSKFNNILNTSGEGSVVRSTFNEELIYFIEQICSDVLRLPDVEENINFFNKGTIYESGNGVGNGGGNGNGSNSCENTLEKFTTKDMITIKGDTQVGKEKFTVMTAILHMFKGIIPVIITRNISGDADKLERGINNYFNLLEKHMRENNKDLPFKLSCIRPHKLKPNLKTIPLVACMGNATQLKYIYDFIKETGKRVLLLIDEVDHVDYGDSDTSEMISNIVSISYQKIGISATVMDVVCSEKSLKAKNILILTKPQDYRGLTDINIKILKHDTRGINHVVNSYKDILDSDLNFASFLEYFSMLAPDFAVALKKYIPNICLIKNTRINANQDIIFDNVIEFYSDKFVVVVYNGNGSKFYYDKMEKCKINNKNVYPKQYVDIDITAILQYLKDNGDVKKFPRILIIAGDYASRCTSFVSRDYEWHLTDMYYNPAASTPISEQVQNVGRLTGRNKDKAHLQLHCTEKVATALFYGYHFCNEVIDRARENPKIENGNEKQFIESVKAVKMLKNKYPVGRKLCAKAQISKHDFNLVKTDDGGKSIDEYKYKIVEEELKTQKEKLKKTETKIDGEIDGVKIRNLDRWMKEDCKLLVSQMLKFLYKQDKEITFDEFKEGIDYRGSDKQFKSNIDNASSIKSYYGFLWKHSKRIITPNQNIKKYLI